MNAAGFMIHAGIKPVPKKWYKKGIGEVHIFDADGNKGSKIASYFSSSDFSKFTALVDKLIIENKLHRGEIYHRIRYKDLWPYGVTKKMMENYLRKKSKIFGIRIPLIVDVVVSMYEAGSSDEEITTRIGKERKIWRTYLIKSGALKKGI